MTDTNGNDSNDTVYENVLYRGGRGTLTFTDRVFDFNNYHNANNVKCSWARVEKRQLSAPGADKHLLKLVLVSGRTVVLEVDSPQTLLKMVKDAKQRMEAVQARKDQEAHYPPRNIEEEEEKVEEGDGDANNPPERRNNRQQRPSPLPTKRHASRRNLFSSSARMASRRNNMHPTRNNTHNNKPAVTDPEQAQVSQQSTTDDSTESENGGQKSLWSWCVCLDNLWCLACAVATLVAVALLVVLIIVLLQKDDNDTSATPTGIPPFGRNEDPWCNPSDLDCPPDVGFESWYGIRRVDYSWSEAEVRLTYEISDYIMDSSLSYVIWDSIRCEDNGEANVLDQQDNPYLYTSLEDHPHKADGGHNIYNEGKGQRHFDVVIQLLPEAIGTQEDLEESPIYVPNPVSREAGAMQLCIGFVVYYNRVGEFSEQIMVNLVENAVHIDVEAKEPTVMKYVQVKTVSPPWYGR